MARQSVRPKHALEKSRSTSGGGLPPRARIALGAIAIAGAAIVAYLPCLRGGFILDDDTLLTDNPLVKSPDGLSRIWFTTQAIDYWPLTNSSFWLEWRVWGAKPTGYHVTNLVLHVASALLVWRILGQLSIPGAWLAALLFAIHPLNVESVAWIAQRKNTLSMLFFLLSILWYLKFDDPGRERIDAGTRAGQAKPAGLGWWYWMSLLAFLLAMLAKGSVATQPVILLLILWWTRGRVSRADAARLVPFFIVAAALAAVNVWFQTHGSGDAFRTAGPIERVLGAAAVVWFYLYKTVLPVDLSFVYPQWRIDAGELRWWLPLVASIAVTALLLRQRNTRWGRSILFPWLIFCAALVPVMGFTDVGFMEHSLVADRYVYIAIIAPLALAAAAVTATCRQQHTMLRRGALLAATAAAVACALLSRAQSRLYANPIALYEHTLEKNPGSWLIHNNLALFYRAQHRFEEAVDHLERSLQLNDQYPNAHMNLGNTLVDLNRIPEAIPHLERALDLNPEYPKAHYNLAFALEQAGRTEDAIRHYERAVALNPRYLEARQNLASLLASIGRSADAIRHYQAALAVNPRNAEVRNNLAKELLSSGRREEGIAQLRQAIAVNPGLALAHFNLAGALMQSGQASEAIVHYRQALELRPDFLLARYNLGTALDDSGRPREAIQPLLAIVKSDPSYLPARTRLITIYAALNRSADAIAMAEETIDLARSTGQAQVAEQLGQWLTAYRAQLRRDSP